MRKFKINVNGKSYDVEVEEIGRESSPVYTAPSTPAPAPKATAQKAEPKKAAAPAPAGAVQVKAPMPGNINDIKVSTGDTVKKGQVLLILEAMKMENEIVAPQDGTVASIMASKGAAVNAGDVLVALS